MTRLPYAVSYFQIHFNFVFIWLENPSCFLKWRSINTMMAPINLLNDVMLALLQLLTINSSNRNISKPLLHPMHLNANYFYKHHPKMWDIKNIDRICNCSIRLKCCNCLKIVVFMWSVKWNDGPYTLEPKWLIYVSMILLAVCMRHLI